MIFRVLVPLIALSLFFLEPTFSLFSPLSFGEHQYILVPHFFAVFLILLAVYDTKKTAILYGIVFGLLYDLYHIDLVGIYIFIYPFIAFLAAVLIKQVHRYFLFVVILAILLLAVVEFLSFGFASAIGFTTITLEQFLQFRLLPTALSNILFMLLFGFMLKWIIVKKKEAQEPTM